MGDTIKVSVNGEIKEYRQMTEQFGNFLAANGFVVSLWEAQQQSRHFYRNTQTEAWRALSFWVTLDESGLTYHITINRNGNHTIDGAAPMPGQNNVKDVYVA